MSDRQILYQSTNRDLTLEQLARIKDCEVKGSFTNSVTFKDAITMGQAPDTGLFVPTEIPQITLDEITSLKGKSFSDAAYLVFRKFLTEQEISSDKLSDIVRCYDFGFPINDLGNGQFLLMHNESPTGDFKNTGARANAKFLQYMRAPGENFIRVTSTSGDTGGAVGVADHAVDGLVSIILYPDGLVSDMQERIMITIGDNVYSFAVKGSFSDIQDRMVKPLFADKQLKEQLAKMNVYLTSGNSINWGRLMPQIVHFVYAYAQIAEPGERIIFSTPLGNMGHGLSGEYARRMGLPIFSVLPTNENDPFPRYMDSGVYRPLAKDEEVACMSNSMIVRNPSNLARMFHLYGGQIDKDGNVNTYPDLDEMKKNMFSPRVTRVQEAETIQDVFYDHGIIIDPHGACAVHGLRQFLEDNPDARLRSVAQITANPYKYAGHISSLIGFAPEKPKAYEWFDGRAANKMPMPFGYEHLKSLVLETARKSAAKSP